jgi:putative membrane protein
MNDRAHADRLIRYTIAFAVCMKRHLRFERDLPELEEVLTEEQIKEIQKAKHLPNFVLDVLSHVVRSAKREGLLGEFEAMTIDANLTQFEDDLGACERILKTKMPFAYVVHLRSFLLLWLLVLPFGCIQYLGWHTIYTCIIVAYALGGLECIGIEIENPFGHDFNDLPLDNITGATITTNLLEILARHHAKLDGKASWTAIPEPGRPAAPSLSMGSPFTVAQTVHNGTADIAQMSATEGGGSTKLGAFAGRQEAGSVDPKGGDRKVSDSV